MGRFSFPHKNYKIHEEHFSGRSKELIFYYTRNEELLTWDDVQSALNTVGEILLKYDHKIFKITMGYSMWPCYIFLPVIWNVIYFLPGHNFYRNLCIIFLFMGTLYRKRDNVFWVPLVEHVDIIVSAVVTVKT
eukprot:UN31283